MAAPVLRGSGDFFLVLVAVGGGMVNARFGGHAVPYGARLVAPTLMAAAIILFMGAVSGAHLNPAVSRKRWQQAAVPPP
jgi:aquaporin Z